MKKIFLLLIIAMFMFASEQSIGFVNHVDMKTILTTNPKKLPHKIQWLKNPKKAFELAKKTGKLIMVDISKTNCPPCEYLYDIVYQYKGVVNYINKNFIPVFYIVDKEKVPFVFAQYFTEVAPTVLFITPQGKLFHRVIGARPTEAFLKMLNNVNMKYIKK